MKKLLAILIILFSFKSYGQGETKKFIIKSKDASICDRGKLDLSVNVSIETSSSPNENMDILDNNYFEQIHHSLNWYEDEYGGDCIGKGISFTTPEIANTTTYYASVNYSGGLPIISDDFKKVDGEGLRFNLTTPTLINFVDVYSNMQGKISVVIKQSDGTQIISKPFTLTNGLNKLPINCSLPSGWGFIIEAFGLSPDIKLTTIKSDKWPISLGTFGEIVEGTENKKKYNYFFNWDISTERVPVNATIIKSTQNITTINECDNYYWTLSNKTYDKSANYKVVKGCHTEKLNLTITPSRKNSEAASACDSYLWSANGKKYETSGTYTTTSNCLTQELNLTIEQSKTNVTTQTSTDSFTWGVNNKKYEISGTYTEIKGCLTEKLVLKVTYTDGVIPQSVLNNRNPDKRKDFVNVHFDPRYTLFDLWSDEPILPDENGIYHIWLSSNEAKTPKQFDGSAEMVSKMTTYKFKSLANCKNWCDNIPFSNTTNSIANSTNTNSNSKTQTFKEVKIGNQIWMKENLNVDHFRNGDPIPEAKNFTELNNFDKNKQPCWCYYNFDKFNGDKYGKMYNYYAFLDIRGISPEGWHIPTYNDWEKLEEKYDNENAISDFNNCISKGPSSSLKTTSGWEDWACLPTCNNCINWNEEYHRKRRCDVCRDNGYLKEVKRSGNGTNSSGFSALPGGTYDGGFEKLGESSGWWSKGWAASWSTASGTFSISNRWTGVNFSYSTSSFNYIRCVKDN